MDLLSRIAVASKVHPIVSANVLDEDLGHEIVADYNVQNSFPVNWGDHQKIGSPLVLKGRGQQYIIAAMKELRKQRYITAEDRDDGVWAKRRDNYLALTLTEKAMDIIKKAESYQVLK